MSKFKREDSLLQQNERQEVEKNLVEYVDIFSRHQHKKRIEKILREKTTKDHSKALSGPIHLKNEVLVGLELMHKRWYHINSSFFQSRQPNLCASNLWALESIHSFDISRKSYLGNLKHRWVQKH